ncbi:hypothetical protein [Oceanidesulfovibrio marinus]|uniref:Uncharacterized protein n=1 Tax=Oceanidesulfovibrio marinus TaxID=370038 RepID=A0A6P1ZQ74_9BACT|nr:hypothetical protein [Oceanidesulfovibrio marinus]QJT08904.1 hypothetical protein E8L03_08170 [Oceanidesulfovibrio marinus]TVM36675.1 hypothetical protein DQK91_01775 [Oceanidesulfovibrio marinus]
MEQVNVQQSFEVHGAGGIAEQMKAIKKARLQRMVYQDPGLAKQLVATEASPVYNAKGEIIQAVSSMDLGV